MSVVAGSLVGMTDFVLSAVVLDCPDARELGEFYRALTGWQATEDSPQWYCLVPPDGGTGLSFQAEPAFVRPNWPSAADHQQMQLHLDILVDDIEAATARALRFGATLAGFQPQSHVRVCLDPVGHPFCLFVH